MKITLLAPDVSSNCMGRVYILAGMLRQRNYQVEIAGPMSGSGVWEPLAGIDIPVKTFKAANLPAFIRALPGLCRSIEGDVIYAVKPLPTSFGTGLAVKMRRGAPLILDIDDWEKGFFLTQKPWRRLLKGILKLGRPHSYLYAALMEKFIPLADALTAASSFLQRKYGGTLIPHARDTDFFNPDRITSIPLRSGKLAGKKIIMFLGTPRPHKGLADLVKAIKLLNDPNITLVIIGAAENERLRQPENAGDASIILLGKQPFSAVPSFLAAADLVVLPQQAEPCSRAQVPAKVFDAMAMARPVIATGVSDLPEILDGCGVIVPPGDPHALARQINLLLQNKDLAGALGRAARRKCIAQYSWKAVSGALDNLIRNLLKKHRCGKIASLRSQ
ncbi:MAG: glycosyltransferase [Peptococcaceae bacterium]|nr:MAG: glycosyltransferase [Peptococcaceae bacterium]